MYKQMYYTDDLVNLTEEIVFKQLHKIIEAGEEQISLTSITVQDIAAIALNNVPPKYVCNVLDKQSFPPSLKAELESLEKFARYQVLKAIQIVQSNPHD
ncbi:late competence development ComFB family protein [Pontibacter sp. JAM-7]|uniref:late competence development ComFB family protein n=1 Tax=Pontibacter sp. JAM-7 TaxID=3366581 RepID=UPI003AF94F2A